MSIKIEGLDESLLKAVKPLIDGMVEIKSALDEVTRQQKSINERLEAIEKSSAERAAGVRIIPGVEWYSCCTYYNLIEILVVMMFARQYTRTLLFPYSIQTIHIITHTNTPILPSYPSHSSLTGRRS